MQNEEQCSHDCSSCAVDCPSRESANSYEALNEYSRVKRVIGVVSGKGGVGKSMVCALSAMAMRRQGYKVGILDADITGPSIPKMFGITGRAMGDGTNMLPLKSSMDIDVISINVLLEDEHAPVVWRGPMIGGVVKQFWSNVVWEDKDFLFIDMPPGTGDVALTVFQSIPVDGILVVASPQELVSMIVDKAVGMANMMNIPVLGLVENMSYILCPDCGEKIALFGESHIEQSAQRFGLEVLARIPVDPALARLCDEGMIENFEGDYIPQVAQRLEEIFA